MKLYDVVFRIVDENVKKVIRYHPIMFIALQQPNSSNVELQTLSISEQKEFRYYVSSFYTLSRYTCDWDPPIKLELAGKPENLAQFILDGHFMECCKKRCVLSDATMCYLNKDIYNRIYTLLCEKFLW